MKKLLIVESPAKIKTINKFLGKDFKIMSTVGHVKDLPEKELGITMNDTIELQYVPLKDKDKVLADIAKEGSKSDEIYLAPDPDREGEIIAWHVAEELKKVVKDHSKIHRITFNEITKTAIEEALKHPTSIDEDKVQAQQARRVLDRWVGYEVSPILWKKITKGLSAGRVQSVALKLIVEREKEIKAFIPEEYWTIDATFGFGKEHFTASLAQISKKKAIISSKEQAEKLEKQIKAVTDYSVTSIKDSERQKNPNAPFMTSTLQQAAYNKLGFSVQKTMQLAQKLYEGVPLNDPQTPVALITYMRSDSLRIADSAIKQVRGYIQGAYGKDYVPAKSLVYSKEKAQDAHEAIRPIDVDVTPEQVTRYLEKDLAKLYTLIWQRFVACQMKAALYAQRQVTIDGGNFTFKVTGSSLLFDGFLRVYNDNDEDEKEQKVIIPAGLKEKSALDLEKIAPKQHFTQPPARFTEASLVKEMEKEGIGRPSTYVAILKNIQARAYTSLDTKKRFVPTELGTTVVDMLSQHLPKIMNIKFTALMEEDLDKIAQGSMQRDILLREFWDAFDKDLIAWKGESTKKQVEKTGIVCPQCKEGELVIRFGKAGSFVGCSRFPECSFTSNFSRNDANEIVLEEQKAPELLDKTCSQCNKQLRTIQGRFGPFIACSGYPECKFIYQEKASFPCPLDGGEVIRRSWKGKVFWGCSNYPKCKFSISGDIEDKPCPKCKKPYLLKRVTKDGVIFLSCADKECGYTKEIQPE